VIPGRLRTALRWTRSGLSHATRAVRWTGIADHTLFDYLQMIGVPVVLLLAGTFVSQAVNAASDRQAAEQAQENRLKDYLSQMTTLVLDRKLLGVAESTPVDARVVREVARAQTITALNGMDGPRKRFVVTFLYEQGLINGLDALVSLATADLTVAELSGAELFGANLERATLAGANFRRSRLTFARLNGADLQRSDLRQALLVDAKLNKSDLRLADLEDAELANASLFDADLRGASLRGASFAGANLVSADLRGADLTRADLTRANLRDALLNPEATVEESETAVTILTDAIWLGTTCPDGTNSDAHAGTCAGHMQPAQ